MSDPFAPNSRDQLIREAQRGLAVVAVLIAVFVYVAFDRLNGRGNHIPEHVRNAPIADTVWPYSGESPYAAQRRGVRELQRLSKSDLVVKQDPRPTQPRRETDEYTQLETSATKPIQQTFVDDEIVNHQPKPLGQSRFNPKSAPIRTSFKAPDESEIVARSTPTATGNLNAPTGSKDKPSDSESMDADFESFTVNVKDVTQRAPFPHGDSPKLISQLPLDPFETTVKATEKTEINDCDFTPIKQFVAVTTPTINHTADKPELIAPRPELPSANEKQLIMSKQAIPVSHVDFEVGPNAGPAPSLNTVSLPTRHQIATGESFYTIAQQYYDDGRYFQALYQFNAHNVSDFDTLVPGSSIVIPSLEDLTQSFPAMTWALGSHTTNIPQMNNSTLLSKSPENYGNDVVQPFRGSTFASSHQIADEEIGATKNTGITPTTKTYITQKGETLFGIAATQLGQASRYLEILELNKVRLGSRVTDTTPLPANLLLILPVISN